LAYPARAGGFSDTGGDAAVEFSRAITGLAVPGHHDAELDYWVLASRWRCAGHARPSELRRRAGVYARPGREDVQADRVPAWPPSHAA